MSGGIVKVNYLHTDIPHVLDKVSGKNLLHNWDFRNPVNQRGQTSYTVSGAYAIDRWKIMGGNLTLTVASGHITLAVSSDYNDLDQLLENYNLLAGKTCTFSIDIDGTIHSATFVLGSETGGKMLTTGMAICSVPTRHIVLRISGGYSFNVRRVKLEEGSVSTLANDPPADYGEELRNCQRFFEYVPEIIFIASTYNTGNLISNMFSFKEAKRISNSTIIYKDAEDTSQRVSVAVFGGTLQHNISLPELQITNSGFSLGNGALTIDLTSGGIIKMFNVYISADL